MPTIAERITVDDLAGPDAPAVLAELRATAPVAWLPAIDGWLVTGHAAAVRVMRDPGTFTVDDPNFSTARVVGPSMLSLDGPAHRRHRTPFLGPFRPRAVADRFADEIAGLVRELLAGVRAEAGLGCRTDLRRTLAGPLAVRVVAGALGLVQVDARTVLDWYAEIVDAVSTSTPSSPVPDRARRAVAALAGHVLAGLGSSQPSVLREATDRLADDEIAANAAVMMFGGIETTEGMILNALLLALRDPALRDAVRAENAPLDSVAGRRSGGLVEGLVEESLRLRPAAAVVDRYSTRPVELSGARIGARDLVRVSLLAANRDPAVFPDPDRVDPHRPGLRAQLAFAQGPHVCIAADLARLETRIALVETLRALPDLRLDGDVEATGHIFRKPAALPVRWRADRP